MFTKEVQHSGFYMKFDNLTVLRLFYIKKIVLYKAYPVMGYACYRTPVCNLSAYSSQTGGSKDREV